MFGLGPLEIVVIGAIAVMLYGRRLPEVGRSFGKTLGDLRRQWTALARELDVAAEIDGRLPSRLATSGRSRVEYDTSTVSTPRFDPPSVEASVPQPGSSDRPRGETSAVDSPSGAASDPERAV